jgi:hypothetical protein
MLGHLRRLVLFLATVVCVLLPAFDARAEDRGKKTCAADLASCPITGCATEGTEDGLVNKIKRTIPPAGTPIRLTFEDFFHLQDQATDLVGQKEDLNEATRAKLRELTLKSSTRRVSEGNLVELIGFVVGLPTRPKASGAEGVNCRLSGVANNDFHIPMALNSDDTEFEGIVVEMIPQNRNEGWTVKKLKRIARETRPVAVRGQLFYDNNHVVNDDPDDVIGGQPKRHSLWEIHPVTGFLVCMKANKKCGQNLNSPQWRKLEDLPN